jgi:hypothetical protein
MYIHYFKPQNVAEGDPAGMPPLAAIILMERSDHKSRRRTEPAEDPAFAQLAIAGW